MSKFTQPEELFVDIDKVIADRKKENKLLGMLPQFVINYVKRTVHQEELNYYLDKFKDLEGLGFIKAVLELYSIESAVVGEHHITDPNGRYLFAANHPIGGWDGMVAIQEISRILGRKVQAIVNDLLMNIKHLHPVFLGVNLYGATSREIVKKMDENFDSEMPLLMFPAGLVSRRRRGKVEDSEWKGTVIKRAVRHKRDIVPVHISGGLSTFFYNLSNVRKAVGIKSNIEMFYLADELFKIKDTTITITFGKPIPYQSFDRSCTHDEWADKLRLHVYALAENANAVYGQTPKLKWLLK